jgi:hypothetical protein
MPSRSAGRTACARQAGARAAAETPPLAPNLIVAPIPSSTSDVDRDHTLGTPPASGSIATASQHSTTGNRGWPARTPTTRLTPLASAPTPFLRAPNQSSGPAQPATRNHTGRRRRGAATQCPDAAAHSAGHLAASAVGSAADSDDDAGLVGGVCALAQVEHDKCVPERVQDDAKAANGDVERPSNDVTAVGAEHLDCVVD